MKGNQHIQRNLFGNMNKTIDVNELKRIQLDILDEFSDYCEKNGLTYYLTYGTLIGAVRHKGYIPWDDDIDVMMPRKDYERFLDGFNKDTHAANIRAISHAIDPRYYLPFAKVANTSTVLQEEVNSDFQIGVYIDVFPLDNLGNDFETAKKLMKKAFRYNEIIILKNLKLNRSRKWYKNAVLGIGKTFARLWNRDKVIEKLNNFEPIQDKGEFTKYVGMINGIYYGDERGIFESKWFEDTVKVEFEGKKYRTNKAYDAFLRQYYGDYMELPPIEERTTHHAFKAWYND